MVKSKTEDTLLEELKRESDKRIKPYWDSLEQESDRAIAIIAACLLDTALEELIRMFYIKERGVGNLFKDDHILRGFFTKISIAYFSGLIPQVLYHDLKLICQIRNRFAHTLTDLDFTDESISRLIQSCELRPKTMDDVSAPKIKYVLIVQQIADALHFFTWLLRRKGRPPLPVEFFKLNEMHWGEATLTKSRILEIAKRKTEVRPK